MEKFIQRAQRILPSNAAVGRLGSIELNLWLAHLVGLPLTGLKKETRLQKYWVLLYGLCVQFALLCYLGFQLYDLCFYWHNVDLMTQNVVISLTHFAYILKVINTYYHYDSLKDIVAKLSAITRETVLSKKQVNTFLKFEMKGKMVMLLYFNLVLLPGIMGLTLVLLFPDDFAGHRFPYRVRIPDFLPPTVQHIYMGVGLALLALCITTIDYLNVLLMGHICMHLKVLNLSFDELKNTKVDPYSWLVSIVKYHCELIVLRQKVERIYSLPVMLQFVSSVVIVAMTAFQVLVGDGSKSSVIMDLLLCCVLCQLFLYCWFGNDVFEQSKTLPTSAFGCNWHPLDKKCKQTLLIVMINAQRPFLFTAGGFMGLSIPSFTYIMSKSYSIVAVLRQMYTRT